MRHLPERERPVFLRQYQEAVAAARDDLGEYKKLKRLLHRWSLAVVATNQPGYYEAIEAAKSDAGAADTAASSSERGNR
ncbi:hypothetical protein GCM10010411_19370 [Actinomadura fulvescens]|uniref:Uncharacterized protein n=2 Tax=Actinomadura fulvescens TaxID=46160 RepID=A0ABN3PN47_9ACTN